MDVLTIRVCRNNHLTVIAESFSRKGFSDTVSKFGRNIVLRVEGLNIVDSFNKSLAYILNPDKTEDLLYTTSLNCLTNAKETFFSLTFLYFLKFIPPFWQRS